MRSFLYLFISFILASFIAAHPVSNSLKRWSIGEIVDTVKEAAETAGDHIRNGAETAANGIKDDFIDPALHHDFKTREYLLEKTT